MKSYLITMDRWLHRIDMIYIGVAAIFATVMMLVTFADVGMRYVLNSPLSWAYDLVTNYLLISTFFFSFSYALSRNEHVAIDVFAQQLPSEWYHRCLAVGYLAVTVVFVTIAWLGLQETLHAYTTNEAMMGAIVWPTWPAKAIVPLGMLPLFVRTAHRGIAHLLADGDTEFQDALALAPSLEPGLE